MGQLEPALVDQAVLHLRMGGRSAGADETTGFKDPAAGVVLAPNDRRQRPVVRPGPCPEQICNQLPGDVSPAPSLRHEQPADFALTQTRHTDQAVRRMNGHNEPAVSGVTSGEIGHVAVQLDIGLGAERRQEPGEKAEHSGGVRPVCGADGKFMDESSAHSGRLKGFRLASGKECGAWLQMAAGEYAGACFLQAQNLGLCLGELPILPISTCSDHMVLVFLTTL
jgi:hypothetical protein